MRSLSLLLLLLATLTPTVASAQLRDVLHPRADLPAFRCQLPADWTNEVDASGNLQLANPPRTANFSMSIVHSPEPVEKLDVLAKAILAGAVTAPWDSREPAEISGYRGYKYTARVKHTNGVQVLAEVILVAVGEQHIAACSMLLAERITRPDETTARLVQAAMKLIPVR